MRKIVICVLALAAFVLSSVTAFAAAGKVEKYGDEYTVIGANWVSEEDGVTESSWISIQIDGSKVEGDILIYGTEYIRDDGEYLGYREFFATLPAGAVVLENTKVEAFHLVLDDVIGQEVMWTPDEEKEEPPEPIEATHSFVIDLKVNEVYKEMFLSQTRYFDVKFRDFSRGVTYAAESIGSVDGEEFAGDGYVGFTTYRGMAIGESEIPEEPKAAVQEAGNPDNDVLITKDDQVQLYAGWEEYDPDTMEPVSYTEIGINKEDKETFSVGYFSISMEGSLNHVRYFEGTVPGDAVGMPKKLEESVAADFTASGLWYEFEWDTESGEEPVLPDPEEGELDVVITWYFEEGRTFRALSKYSSGTYSRMVHESVDTSEAWTEGTIDGESFTGMGDVSIGRFMTREKGEFPWEK
ncbi:MAG: hypothetical protein K0M69_12955 [Youngiibacter sp.]|nr:hypothetical protein [Youngiibacter sp.]